LAALEVPPLHHFDFSPAAMKSIGVSPMFSPRFKSIRHLPKIDATELSRRSPNARTLSTRIDMNLRRALIEKAAGAKRRWRTSVIVKSLVLLSLRWEKPLGPRVGSRS
jgi:hypothetical protein